MGLGVLLPNLASDLGDGSADDDLGPVEVDIGPPQRTRLAPPTPGRDQHPQVRSEVGIVGLSHLEQLLNLLDGGRDDLPPTLGRGRGVHRWVAGDEAPPPGLL